MAGWLRAFLGCCALVFSGCGFETATLTLWTDAPEFAFYAQAFNTAQVKYKIEVHEKRTLGLELETAARERRPLPDIVAGKWLKAASLLGLWQKTDFLFAKNSVHKKMFYDVLLEFGRNGKEQLLLPVSFNLGAMVFMPDAVPSTPPLAALSAPNPAPLTLAEVRRAGAAFNLLSGGVYTRTGFSPTWEWNGDFLYTAAR
ncbi:MAG: hypothetical protein LBC72_05280, partial [Spirochaetaceae bacterium]|nr:hypothetical protein [Spirochaetaceae bacterium]